MWWGGGGEVPRQTREDKEGRRARDKEGRRRRGKAEWTRKEREVGWSVVSTLGRRLTDEVREDDAPRSKTLLEESLLPGTHGRVHGDGVLGGDVA